MPRHSLVFVLGVLVLSLASRVGVAGPTTAPADRPVTRDAVWAARQAILDEDAKAVEAMLDAGMPANAGNGTLLYTAAGRGNLEIVEILLEHGASPDRPFGGPAPLVTAACHGQAAVVQLLLQAGARDGMTRSLSVAARYGRYEILRMLIDRGVDVNCVDSSRTALFDAAEQGEFECVELLVKSGADPVRTDRDGRTAADLARKRGYESVAAMIDRYAKKPVPRPVQ